jgi:CheY-like chemotaxis protein
VQRHSAEIGIDSLVGQGTTVRLIFAEAFQADPVVAPAAVAAPTNLRILLVDDDPVLLHSLREIFEADGHEVTTANGGREGIEFFRESVDGGKPFSVVVTDLGMPYVDGRQVASAIKGLSSTTPVILLTGWGARLQAEGDLPAHVEMVLAKPPKLRDLREALARCCAPAA